MSLNYDPRFPTKRPELDLTQPRSSWWLFPPRGEYVKSLDHQALKYVPETKDLVLFERLNRQERQLLLARLHRLEAAVNLKPLAIPLALLSAVVVFVGIQMRSVPPDDILFWYMMLSALGILAIFGLFLIPLIRSHNRKEACLAAWTATLKDSHSHLSKIEDEGRAAQTKIQEENRRIAYERTRR
ncbi:UNVERIFIED_CONTAM: hypothetical protein ABIE34_003899 [Jeotgalibacillus campisalis]